MIESAKGEKLQTSINKVLKKDHSDAALQEDLAKMLNKDLDRLRASGRMMGKSHAKIVSVILIQFHHITYWVRSFDKFNENTNGVNDNNIKNILP